MAERSRVGLAELLRAVAYAGLGLAAIGSPARPGDVAGIVLGGHVLWGLAWLAEPGRRPRGAVGLLSAVFAAFAAVEAVGLWAATSEGQSSQALWFLVALSFAAAGIASVRRAGPTDAALAVQLLFHGLMALPALAVAVRAGLRALAGPAGSGMIAAAPLVGSLGVVASVGVPILFAGLLGALAVEGVRCEGRSPLWTALLAHQAAFALVAARWAGGGL